MPRSTPVRAVMSTDVVWFKETDTVQTAYQELVDHDIDGAPVLSEEGHVVGMLTTDDLLVQESKLHYPTVISLFGAYLELPSSHRHFEEDLRKAVGATVGDVMSREVHTVGPDDGLERAATLMHEHKMSRLPVIGDGRLLGIVSRGDILRAVMGEGASE
jgi:CBS domain-containing protein